MTMTFKDLGLAQPLLQATEALGFTTPTPVQAQIIPHALEGGDWMVSSQTGSGKTAAFLLPLLHQLLAKNPNNKPVPGRAEPQVLVLCPTRELAQQVANDAINLVKFCKGIRLELQACVWLLLPFVQWLLGKPICHASDLPLPKFLYLSNRLVDLSHIAIRTI